MRILSLPSPLSGLLVLTLAMSGAAHAERLTMPYDCQFDGERVTMRPSADRSYEIYGRHEREIYTACSPADANRCRSWQVHRFDFSCSGVRVPWIDAAAAGARSEGRDAWVEGGSFHLTMGPMWTNDRPSFRNRGWWQHRYPRDDYGAGDGGRVVTLPPGYAPALGIPVTFTGTPSEQVAQAPFPPATVARAPAAAPKDKVPALPERAPRNQAAPPAAAAAVVATAPASPAPAPAPAPKVAAAPEVSKAPSPTVAVPGSVTPTLINGPSAAPATPAAAPAAPKSAGPAAISEVRVADASATTSATETAAKDAATAPAPALAPDVAPTETASIPAPPHFDQKTIVILGGAAAVLLTLTSLVVSGLWRWSRGPKRLPPPSTRDIASISFDRASQGAPQGTSMGTSKGTSLAIHPKSAPPTLQAPPPLLPGNAGFGSPGDVPIPATYPEALEVLGAGPDASLVAIKKIVDGMRQSWHPDLARSEADRRVRERRLQQVNVAWDLVSRHRSAA
jgi:hypothetical protein